MAYQLPDLTYDYSALEPHIDARTMEIHHTKHHQTYITNVNKALEAHPDLANMSIVELMRNVDKVPQDIKQVVINHGGGHLNHCLFWTIMGPNGGGEPTGELKSVIDRDFGSFADFRTKFNAAAASRFGSGWAWLSWDNGKLIVESSANQDSPVMQGRSTIMGIDVWEHAYYLNYQNRRADYVEAWWNVIDWSAVAKNLEAAKAQPGVLATVR
ncbi:MAG: superoxide dismutase [Candidatus Sericytochromatia bacterium]